MINNKIIKIVLHAGNFEATLVKISSEIPLELVDDAIVLDDNSLMIHCSLPLILEFNTSSDMKITSCSSSQKPCHSNVFWNQLVSKTHSLTENIFI
jgi:hypothetical protein